jgi:carbamoyltransferase
MTVAYRVRDTFREPLRAVINVDGSCRPQILDEEPTLYRRVLEEMKRRTGLGAVLNTSFNVHGEPIVCTPADAVKTLLETGAPALVMGPFVVTRRRATPQSEPATATAVSSP